MTYSYSLDLANIRRSCEDIMDTVHTVGYAKWTPESVVKLAESVRDLALIVERITQSLPND